MRAVRVVHLPLETDEEVGLVLDDRATDHAAPLPLCNFGFLQLLFVDEKIPGGETVARPVPEHHTLELVRSGLGDGVDDGPACTAELRVVHARDDLKLLDRLERGAHLRARTGAERVVRVVAAVDRDVVVLAGLAGGNDRVVAHLVGGGELDARQQSDRRKIVTVHRGKLAELLGPDVAAHFDARRVNQRRLRRHLHRFFEAPDRERQGNRHGVPDLQEQTAPFGRPEACQLGSHPIRPRHQLGHEEGSRSAADDIAKHASSFVGDDDRNAGQDRALLVAHLSADFCRPLLRKERRGSRQYTRRKHQSEWDSAHLTASLDVAAGVEQHHTRGSRTWDGAIRLPRSDDVKII